MQSLGGGGYFKRKKSHYFAEFSISVQISDGILFWIFGKGYRPEAKLQFVLQEESKELALATLRAEVALPVPPVVVAPVILLES